MPHLVRFLSNRRLFWGLTGVLALSALIWLVAPLLPATRFGDPGSRLSRQLLIALCLLLWFLLQLLPQLWRRRTNARLLARLQMSGEEQAELQATGEMLDDRFLQALQLLKTAQFGSAAPRGLAGWLAHRRAPYLYQLPWYLIIGAPGAGKTSALVNSGLEFPLASPLGNTAMRGIGGTRHCDWWFSRQAVLLDTAGRYALQESQRTRDAGEWQTFIRLLKRYRPRQPINGVIVTLSVADLLGDAASARQAQASALRQRLEELHQQTGITFPVYVMVTKTDLLQGFVRYYQQLDKSERAQRMGISFPWPEPVSHAQLLAEFTPRFQQLCGQLTAGLADRMAQETDLSLRAECFQFPQEFAALAPLLTDYLSTLFASDRQLAGCIPRGLFFTSATQEGLPFDRVMGELSRKLQLPPRRQPSLSDWDSVSRQAPIPAGKGQSFFIHDLLTRVVFAEHSLAGSDGRWEQRQRLLHRLGYAALGGGLLLCCALWLTSYQRNQQWLQQVGQQLPRMQQQASRIGNPDGESFADLLPLLNSLASLAHGDAFALDAPPAALRAGLYRGDQVGEAATSVYQVALKSLLLPQVTLLITATLRNDDGQDPRYSRRALSAYQMLYQPQHYNGAFLRGWVMQQLTLSAPRLTDQQRSQLEEHLSALLVGQVQRSPFARDNQLLRRGDDDRQQ